MYKYSFDPELYDVSQLSKKDKILVRSLYTAFNSQETLSTLWIIREMSIGKVFFLEKVFEEGIYYVCRGDVFVITLNVRLHNVTKHISKVAVFALK